MLIDTPSQITVEFVTTNLLVFVPQSLHLDIKPVSSPEHRVL
jgi:hypothetical protein